MINKKQAELEAKKATAQAAMDKAKAAMDKAKAEMEAAQAEFKAVEADIAAIPQVSAEELKAAMEVVQYELDNLANDRKFDAEALATAMENFDADFDVDDEDAVKVLAAAFEYYGGDVANTVTEFDDALTAAFEAIDSNYTFIAEAYDVGSLGKEILARKLRDITDADTFDWVLEYFNCEGLGENIMRDYDGKFTAAGFFAAEDIDI